MRASIYAANLFHGGGSSGAATFLNDLPELHEHGDLDGIADLEVVVSTNVAGNLADFTAINRVPGVRLVIRDEYPRLSTMWSSSRKTKFDAQLVIRGPHYAPIAAKRTILGFADGTMYYPRPEGLKESLPFRANHAGRNFVKRRMIPRYDGYVVQTRRMAERLRRDAASKPVWIIPNSPSPVFSDSSSWRRITLPPQPRDSVRLFYPARGYPHKNHALIGSVGQYLQERYGVGLDIVTTLRDAEYSSLPAEIKRYCTNIGEVTLVQCPGIYRDCEGVFFASLNETSSVTPLEGMLMGRPVLASDRDFVRDIAGEVPFYFDPLDATSAGDTIMRVFRDGGASPARLEEGRVFVKGLLSPFERSRAYIRILKGFE